MDAKDFLKDLLLSVVSAIVTYPDDLRVDVKTDEMGVLYTLSCHDKDRGKIIGRAGANATAIRTILSAAGMTKSIRASLLIDVPDFRKP